MPPLACIRLGGDATLRHPCATHTIHHSGGIVVSPLGVNTIGGDVLFRRTVALPLAVSVEHNRKINHYGPGLWEKLVFAPRFGTVQSIHAAI